MKTGMSAATGNSRGFTLIEIVITIVLVSIMLAGLTSLFTNQVNNSYRPYLRQRALAVANAIMEEISHKRWDENSPLGGGCVNAGASCAAGPVEAGIGTEEGARGDYDDVDDYATIVNQSPPQDSAGSPMPGYAGFSVTVTIVKQAWNGVPLADSKHITVAVTSPANETITLQSYRLNI